MKYSIDMADRVFIRRSSSNPFQRGEEGLSIKKQALPKIVPWGRIMLTY